MIKVYGILPGILFKILNLNFFCLFSIVLLHLGNAMPVPVLFFCTNFIGITLLLPFMIASRFSLSDLIRNGRTFIMRGCFNTLGICSWFFAMKYIGPNEATAITFMIPILTLILSAIFCNDKFHYNIIVAVFTCIFGASIIIYPKLNMQFTVLGCMYAMISSCCWASYDIICKIQSKTEGPFTQTFKSNIYSAIIMLMFSLIILKNDIISYIPVVLENIKFMSIASILTILNITALFCAYRATKVSNLMPLGYFRLFFMSIYAYFFFGDVVNINTMVGGFIIFTSNLLVLRFNLKKDIASNSA